ncbi:MAG: ABC transporter ATP-binding protein [Desulfovibrio sp.]|jgi:sulfonate transport system ATP-binding protein|nr:ABC transporter ATP-binding protein [Desulfovibrio sp.]
MSVAGKLEIKSVSKHYDVDQNRLQVLSGLSFDVHSGHFLSIVGASGCGKSTLLRLISGLDDDYEGDILLSGEHIYGPSLKRGIVFQDHRLLPWLTLEQNIGLSLENTGWSARAKKEAIRAQIELVGLSGFEKAYTHQLSGGMAQRAAIARALANKPEILLLDEPLGALDAITRIRLQEEMLRIWRVEGTTMILVTHDVDEAIFLSNEIVVMSSNPGRITKRFLVNLATPRDRASAEFIELKRQVLVELHLYRQQSKDAQENGIDMASLI